MYPSEYYSLFPSFPRLNQVFVAMSFADEFTHRWENIIKPAAKLIEVDKKQLGAHRVDVKNVSDSILTEILNGISQSRLVIADITSMGIMNGTPIRNANVLYEVGLAQAVRLPEEVLLFRSDNDPLLFDVTNIRVNSYNPDEEPEEAIQMVSDAILSSLNEVDLKRNLTVQRLAKSLDYPSWWTLNIAYAKKGIAHPDQKSMGQIIGSFSTTNAISRLLDIGALSTQFEKMTPEKLIAEGDNTSANILMQYQVTELGKAIFLYCSRELGMFDPKLTKVLEERFNKEQAIEELKKET